MLGAIVGDIVGSIYEWNNHRSKDFPFFGPGADYTDDSVLTAAVADALLNGHPPQKSLFLWATRHPKRGYGGGFERWLRTWELAPYDSWGNGAAMRVSPAALLANTLDEALALATRVTEVTHDHPEGIKGAKATAHAIFLARFGATPDEIRRTIAEAYGYDMDRTVDAIRLGYRFNESCQETVPESLICALEATSFEDAIRNAISIGGDSDTVAAIAGPVAEALFGIPDEIALQVLERIPGDMREVLYALYARTEYAHPVPGLRPAIPVAGLRPAYEALLPIEELPGERTYRIRLGGGWQAFVYYGPDAAQWLRQEIGREEDARDSIFEDEPELVELVMKAWPG
ncbi:MAG: ADP-ribosylglycohydrolase family protein [Gemmatimonadetes bacterium]|nr:ADP-ribosylglycohydrolase family protein [Gemmatimonadota bacterium]